MAHSRARSAPSARAALLLAVGLAALLAGSGAGGQDVGGALDIEADSPSPFIPRLKVLVQDGDETRLRVLRPGLVGTLAELLAELGSSPGSHGALQYRLPDTGAGEPEQWVTVKDDVDAANMFAEFEAAAAEAGGASRRFKIRLGLGTGSAEQVLDDPKEGAFADRAALQAAVDSCLATDPTGINCCARGADCGAAGTDEMSNWDVSLVTDMNDLFLDKTQFNADISRWNTAAVTLMSGMFFGASAFNGDISRWDTSAVTVMSFMFARASAFNGDISKWNVGAVTRMCGMFTEAAKFNQDISNWNVGGVTVMNSMFDDAAKFNNGGQPLTWNTAAVANMSYMFSGAADFNQDISSWNTAAVTHMIGMFSETAKFNNGGQPLTWNTAAVTETSFMFDGANAFNRDISNWDLGAVTNNYMMWNGANAMTEAYKPCTSSGKGDDRSTIWPSCP